MGKSSSANGGGGIRWDVDPKTRQTGAVGPTKPTLGDASSASVLSNNSGAVTDDLLSATNSNRRAGGVHADAEYRRDFAGDDHNLTVDLDVDRKTSSLALAGANSFTAPIQPDSFQRADTDEVDHDLNFQGDYVRPMPTGGKLKAGWDIHQDDDLDVTSGFATSPHAAPN